MAKKKTSNTATKTRAPSKPAEFVATRVVVNSSDEEMTITLAPGQTAYLSLGGVHASQADARPDLGAGVNLGETGAIVRHSFGPKTAEEPKRTVSPVIFR